MPIAMFWIELRFPITIQSFAFQMLVKMVKIKVSTLIRMSRLRDFKENDLCSENGKSSEVDFPNFPLIRLRIRVAHGLV